MPSLFGDFISGLGYAASGLSHHSLFGGKTNICITNTKMFASKKIDEKCHKNNKNYE